MIYKTKICPHCGRSIQIRQPDRGYEYGSPLRVCQYCEKIYVDQDFRELTLESPNKNFRFKSIARRVISIVIFGICSSVLLQTVAMLFSEEKEFFSVDPTISHMLIAIGFVLSFLLFFPTSKRLERDSEELERVWQESFNRMKNPVYVEALQEAGFIIPTVILEKISDDKSNNTGSLDREETAKPQKDVNNGTKGHDSSQNNEIQVDALINLKALFDEGIITDEEYAEKKKKILGL